MAPTREVKRITKVPYRTIRNIQAPPLPAPRRPKVREHIIMSDGATDRGSIDAPFEWLTNFRSLRHLLLPSRVAFGRTPPPPSLSSSSSSSPSQNNRDDDARPEESNDDDDDDRSRCPESSSSASSSSPTRRSSVSSSLNALHVGCGTSTAGESLLRLREERRVSAAGGGRRVPPRHACVRLCRHLSNCCLHADAPGGPGGPTAGGGTHRQTDCRTE